MKPLVQITLTLLLFVPLFCGSALAEESKSSFYKGLDLYHAGNYKGAVEEFELQLSETPDDTSIKRWLTLAGRRADEPQKGQTIQLAKAITPHAGTIPSELKDRYERGIDLFLSKEYEAARQSFKRFLDNSPGHSASQQWLELLETPPSESEIPQIPFPSISPRQTNPHLMDQIKMKDEEITQLKMKLEKSKELTRRAMEQTKRALALPAPESFD